MRKQVRLLKDIVIPKGTVFECIDGRTTKFANGNYSINIGMTDDSTAEFIIGYDELDDKLKDVVELV